METPFPTVQEARTAIVPPQTSAHGVGNESSGSAAAPVDGGKGTLDRDARGGDPDIDIQEIPIPNKGDLKYPNLGSHLDRLVTSVQEGQATVQDAAEGAAIYQDESIAVTIYLSGKVDEVVEFLKNNGGDPRNVGEDYIEAYVPLTLLGSVSEQPGVIRVREIVPPQEAGTVPESPP